MFNQCTEQTLDPVVNPGAAPTITNPENGGAYTVTLDNLDDLMTRFEWTAADFGFQAGIEYTLELDLAGNDFENPLNLGTVNALCGGYLRQIVSIDDAQAKELHAAGKEINEELKRQLNEMKKEAFRESISGLSDSFQEKLLEVIGDGAITGLPGT